MTQSPALGRTMVTGCAGFIGSHFAERLLAEGHTVTGYDNLSLGKKAWIEPLLAAPRFTFIQADLLDAERLTEAIKGHDTVIHLGANTDIPRGHTSTKLDLENCTIATFNVLEAMRVSGVRQLLFASSATVYGDRLERLDENSGPFLPISLYGAAKLACEGLISAYCHLYGLQSWIFRFGNVVGARMGHGVLRDFIAKLQKNPRALEILGDGNQEKNYFLVEDCIDGMLYAFHHAHEESCQVFNLGTETTIKVTEIARIVVEEMSLRDVAFSYTGGRRGWPGDAPVVIYDVSKMKRLTWKARYSSAEAVRIATARLLGKE